jgi:hypothetical protein
MRVSNVREMTSVLLDKFNGLLNHEVDPKEMREICNASNTIARQVKLELTKAIINRTKVEIHYLDVK